MSFHLSNAYQILLGRSAPDEAVGLYEEGDQHLRNHDVDGTQEDILHEVYDRAIEVSVISFDVDSLILNFLLVIIPLLYPFVIEQ